MQQPYSLLNNEDDSKPSSSTSSNTTPNLDSNVNPGPVSSPFMQNYTYPAQPQPQFQPVVQHPLYFAPQNRPVQYAYAVPNQAQYPC
jgi:hypothetical protein